MSAGERFERAPDGIGPLIGYRMWQIEDEDDEPVFFPLSHPSRDWKGATRGWVSASCSVGSDQLNVSPDGELTWGGRIPHRVPGEGCTCGFYAMKELDAQLLYAATMAVRVADRTGMDEVFVLGRVELAGKVIEHDLGYRAERARIVELIPFRDQQRTVEAIARRAGVDVGQPIKLRRMPIRDRLRRLRFAWAASRAMAPSPASPTEQRNHRVLLFLFWAAWVAFRVWGLAHDAGAAP
jgi:hypothetical protein